jgi:KDO2-lipid IV(A) lauroyltransferase
MNNKFYYAGINQFIFIILAFIKVLPQLMKKQLLNIITLLIWPLAKKTRRCSINNITTAMPWLSQKEVKKLAYTSYKNIVYGLLETSWLSEIQFEYSLDDNSRKLLLSGDSITIATLHFGCCEAVPYAIQKITGRSTTMSNIPLFAESISNIYKDLGIDCVNKRDKGRFLYLLNAIRQKRVVSLHADHNGTDTRVCFFGRETSAASGVAMLSHFGKTPLLLSYATKEADNKYRVHIETVTVQPVSNGPDDFQKIMQNIHNRFEKIILLYPEQWFWSYNRWRQ